MTATTKITKSQYRALLRAEYVRLAMLGGEPEKTAKAAVRPAAVTIDRLKELNAELRRALTARGVDHRTEAQRAADAGEHAQLVETAVQLATAGGHDGEAKRPALAAMTIPQLRRIVSDARTFQARAARDRVDAAGRAADIAARDAGPASPAQIDLIMAKLAKRSRDGEGGGFMTGPTNRAGAAAMTFADASAYIDSLTGNY